MCFAKNHSNKIVQLSEQVIQTELKELVCQSVEEVLNGLLDAESDRLINAYTYERKEGSQETRAGHYPCKLLISSGR